MLVENDPAVYTREMSFDAEQLNFFLNDRVRAQEIIRTFVLAEKEKEKEPQKKQKKEKSQKTEGSQKEEPEAALSAPAEPKDTSPVSRTQSTLFDGF
jgi:replication factor C large subunit